MFILFLVFDYANDDNEFFFVIGHHVFL